MGGFHVILFYFLLFYTIYSRFKDSGIIELLVETGAGTKSTIRGGDVRQGICYYKIIYEAFTISKVNFLTNSNRDKL